MHSKVVEDYLKAVHEIQQGNAWVKTSALAEKLAVTSGSVTDMIKRLSKTAPRLLTYRSYKGVKLTPAGERAASDVIRRHRLLETFLHQIFGFQWDEVHEEAEILEHYVSERLTDAIDAYLKHPRYDPHGEPIPRKGETALPDLRISLVSAPLREPLRIAGIQEPAPELLRYLEEIGIRIGRTVVVLEKAPLNGPLTLRLAPSGPDRSISLETAHHILVETVRTAETTGASVGFGGPK